MRPWAPGEGAARLGPPATPCVAQQSPAEPGRLSDGAHTFCTLCGASPACPLGRNPRHRPGRISSLGSGNLWHSGCILLCRALRGVGKGADVRDRPSHVPGLLRCLRRGCCSDAPRPPSQPEFPGAHWVSALGCPRYLPTSQMGARKQEPSSAQPPTAHAMSMGPDAKGSLSKRPGVYFCHVWLSALETWPEQMEIC